MPRIFSSNDIGRLVGADPSSVNRWIDAGKLRAHRTPGGHRRVFEEDLRRFLDELELPLPEELAAPAAAEEPLLLLGDADGRHLRALSDALLRLRPALQLVTCSAPLEALLRVGVYRPELALLDVQMPGLDWPEACRAILATAETAGTRLLACAAHPTAPLEAKLKKAGVLALLRKPVEAKALLEWLSADR